MAELERTGRCLCGNVKFEVTLSETSAHVCHCRICQKWGGGPNLSIRCESGWKIDGEESITWYDSSDHAQRGFCKNCGTHLFFRTQDGSYYGVTAALDNQDDLDIGEHIFIDSKPSYYDFADDRPRLTEKEFLERIGLA